MKGWYNDRYRHSLAARGLTRRSFANLPVGTLRPSGLIKSIRSGAAGYQGPTVNQTDLRRQKLSGARYFDPTLAKLTPEEQEKSAAIIARGTFNLSSKRIMYLQELADKMVPKEGQTSKGPTPMELVLVAVAGCTGMDIIDILRKKRLNVTGLEVKVVGTRAETFPMVYTKLDVVYIVRGKDIPPSAVEQAIQLSEEKYCSVGIMIGKAAPIKSRYEIVAE